MDIQQDLFNNTELDLFKEQFRRELLVVKQRSDNVRRGLFARHNELVKTQQNQQVELDIQKKDLEELKSFVYSMGMQKVG